MLLYMPEIFYHDRQALLSVDLHPVCEKEEDGIRYKFATSSVQNEVRIWSFDFDSQDSHHVDFVANLSFHLAAVNQVKFCPNPEFDLLASGDCHGGIAIWQLSDAPITTPPMEDFPKNKENWIRLKVFHHESDITSLCWSPCGQFLASVSNDDSLQVHVALTGKRTVMVNGLRHFPNGISWDPSGKYLITQSTDRKMDLLDAARGTRLRTFGAADLPAISVGGIPLTEKNYRLFHDDQLVCFQRGVCFSPCGQLVIAPCGRLEVGANDIHATLVFKRSELEKDRPAVILPCEKPTFLVRFCPKLFKLKDSETNYSGLPYRTIWLVLTKESVIFYDSQHPQPIGLIENISYNNLSDATWSSDGGAIIISSIEGYCTFVKMRIDEWGEMVIIDETVRDQCPPSPQLIKPKKKREKKEKVMKEEERATSPAPTKLTPLRPAVTPSTPKSGGLLKFLKKSDSTTPFENSTAESNLSGKEPKAKKRINLITL